MNNFIDISYLTGKSMHRNQNINKDIANIRAPHLKRCTETKRSKKPKKKSEIDDLHIHTERLKKKILRSTKFTAVKKRPPRISLEPQLNIFGQDMNKPHHKFGIFTNSVMGRSFDLVPKLSKQKISKKTEK